MSAGIPARAGDFLLDRRWRLVRDRVAISGRTLCDLGCGNGAQTLRFAGEAGATIGVDISRGSLREFRDQSRLQGLGERVLAVHYDGSGLPLADSSVDVATCFEVLEHVDDEETALAELFRVLKPGGRLAISVPNRWWIFETHGAELPLLPWNRVPFFSWLPKSIHDRYARARIYTRGEIRGLLERTGFELGETLYVTAPMDVLRVRPLQRLLRATLFSADQTALPFLAVSVLALARRPD